MPCGPYLEGAGLDLERFESRPGRQSLVARIDGTQRDAPALCLMGHTDVVPANANEWKEDPFSGALIGDEIWGRGAIDMLNSTATMAVAMKELGRSRFRPKGSLIYLAVADEEAGGDWGTRWLVEKHWDAVAAAYVLTESGGFSRLNGGRRRVIMHVAEKGMSWQRLVVKGVGGHGSMPFGVRNALVLASEVIQRLSRYSPQPRLIDLWYEALDGLDLPASTRAALSDATTVRNTLESLPAALARRCHALTHDTISPNVVHGGQKVNVIPDEVVLEVDIRTLPGTTRQEVDANLLDAVGDLAKYVDIYPMVHREATRSRIDNPLWASLQKQARVAYPNCELSPALMTGGSDGRHFREKGAVAIGAALYSPQITPEVFTSRLHGEDERIDLESLSLSLDLWIGVAQDLLS